MSNSHMMKNIFLVSMVLNHKVEISKITKYGVHLNNMQSRLSQLNTKMCGVLSNGQALNWFKSQMEKFIFILLLSLKQSKILFYKISSLQKVPMIIQQEHFIMDCKEPHKLKQEKLESIQSILRIMMFRLLISPLKLIKQIFLSIIKPNGQWLSLEKK